MFDDLFSLEISRTQSVSLSPFDRPSQHLLTQWLKMEYFSDRYSRHKSLAMPLRWRCFTPQTALHDLFLRFMISGLDRPKPNHSFDLLDVVTISIHTNCTLQFWWPLLHISQPCPPDFSFGVDFFQVKDAWRDWWNVIIKTLFSACCRVWRGNRLSVM